MENGVLLSHSSVEMFPVRDHSSNHCKKTSYTVSHKGKLATDWKVG